MRARSDLKLRKIGRKYILVEVRNQKVNITDVFTMNATAAFLWQRMCERDFTVNELAETICQRFEVAFETAVADISRQLEEWKEYGLLV